MTDMLFSLILGRIASIFGVAGTPFLVISDTVTAAIVAGGFSVINMVLNIILVKVLRPQKELIQDTHDVAQETKKIVDRRIEERDM